ncbi:iron uptake porin [Alkalinema sp. FACHB-956]|uniref:iron uptake porin n=1 Tax=Alkalinema sp. FACHB-956 TaxID=2692768 RepID=UPI00168486A2|nr:iron uptake porin [Alkalinema sp. FACHB-956]MBD2326926.1 iron uptake porin [Alkalinema sp. FACHB-956]
MLNQMWNLRLTALLSATLAISTAGAANASEVAQATQKNSVSLSEVQSYSDSSNGVAAMSQVTSVSQLSDVKPTDWAFQALQSLVERYGCIAGYPDRTYRGNRAMTRYEFAAGLNACMDRVNELIAAATADLVKKEDLATLQKLQEEFAAELATLRGRVDALEAKTATLEKQQFSTTTKLRGEVIFSVSGALGDEKAVSGRRVDGVGGAPDTVTRPTGTADVDENTTLSTRVRIGLSTSFTGKDQLFTRLQARNVPNFQTATGTNMSRLSYGDGTDTSVTVDKVYYRFSPSDKLRLTIDAIGGEFYGNVNNYNPGVASDSQGSISRFGRFNPIYRYGQGGSGATANINFSDKLSLDVGFLADEANDPANDKGLFAGSFGALAQLNFQASKDLGVGLTYVRGYDRGGNINAVGGTGSVLANRPFGANVATASDNFGIQASFRLNPSVVISGWGGLTRAYNRLNNQDSTILNWAGAVSFPDLGKKGNLGAVIVGMPPKNIDADNGAAEDTDTSLHVEALYRYQINDKISITPGFLVIFNPEHNRNNDTIYVGTLRTTFTF